MPTSTFLTEGVTRTPNGDRAGWLVLVTMGLPGLFPGAFWILTGPERECAELTLKLQSSLVVALVRGQEDLGFVSRLTSY